jgi:hypothetical protein
MTSLTKGRTRILVFVAVLALPVALAAEVHCPSSTPPPGSTVNGGLDVDGTCSVNNVTVNGGITVESGGHLSFTNSTVNGGIVALPCGELDVNASTDGFGVPTLGATSFINGGIDIEASDVCPLGAFSNADIWNAKIFGGISITGTYRPLDTPYICSNQIKGNIDVHNLTAVSGFTIGDPDENSCTGNTISGAFIMSNSSLFKVESNTIGGSVLLSASTLELNGNTIGGSLKCSNNTMILPGEAGDPTGNTVHGETHCP